MNIPTSMKKGPGTTGTIEPIRPTSINKVVNKIIKNSISFSSFLELIKKVEQNSTI